MGQLGCGVLDTQQRPLGDGARLRGCFIPAQPRPWSPPAVGRLGPVSLNPRAEMPNFGSGLPLPTLWDRWDLWVSVLSACLFVSGSLVVSPSSPILLPREEAPEVACPLLSHTHTHSLSLFPVCKLSSGVGQRQRQEKPAPAPTSRHLPCPVLPSPTRHPQFPKGPPAMSDPDVPRGPDAPAMWPPCSRGA